MENQEQYNVTAVTLRDNGVDITFRDGSRAFYNAFFLHAARDLATVLNSMDNPDGESLLPDIPDEMMSGASALDLSRAVNANRLGNSHSWHHELGIKSPGRRRATANATHS